MRFGVSFGWLSWEVYRVFSEVLFCFVFPGTFHAPDPNTLFKDTVTKSWKISLHFSFSLFFINSIQWDYCVFESPKIIFVYSQIQYTIRCLFSVLAFSNDFFYDLILSSLCQILFSSSQLPTCFIFTDLSPLCFF